METNEEASIKNSWRTKLKTENEEIFWNDGLRRITRKEFKKCSGWYKRIPHIQNDNEDGMKLEPWIFKRMPMIKRNSSPVFKSENDDEKCHEELLSTPEWRIKKVETMVKRIESDLGEGTWLMGIILTSHLKRISEYSGKEESGKILGKDLWVRAH